MPLSIVPISAQGSAPTGSSDLIFQPITGYIATITNLSFSNTSDAAFDISLSIYRADSTITTLIYKKSIAVKGVLIDTGMYILNTGDKLLALASDSDTVFVVNGWQVLIP